MPATDQLEALKLLAHAAQGCTVPFLLDHGCSVAALRHLARRRLAITDRVPVPGHPKSATVVGFRISKAGRQALLDSRRNGRKISIRPALLVLFALGMFADLYVGAFVIPHL